MRLSEMPAGSSGTVTSVDDSSRVGRRLSELGVVPGVRVSVIKHAPFGDPVEVRLLRYNLALRKEEAAVVEIDPASTNGRS
ncbi:MAG: ferrous iron transport protein A [Acidobacteria bacterium]|nr:ferrous iron transport protein A [Acidobacteriota bacterium]